jgi:serine/threonine-protein kinase RsbW
LAPRTDGWHCLTLRHLDEVSEVVETVVVAMKGLGFEDKDLFAVRLALDEALVNALKHGNQHDPTKQAWLRYHLTREEVLMEVEDQGAGFDPAEVPDPLEPENLERACGRGLLLIRTYMSRVRHNPCGNCITMCRRRSSP